MRRLALSVLTLLALALPTAAAASTQWFFDRQPIPAGVVEEVPAYSTKLTLALKPPKVTTTTKISCTATGRAAFWNEPEGGRDETLSMSYTCLEAPCGDATVTVSAPWGSTLLETAVLPFMDRETGDLDFTCGGVDYGTFAGSIEAKVGDNDPEEKAETGVGDLDNFLVWRGSAKDSLLAASGYRLWFIGSFHLGGKGWGITDEAGDN